MFEKMRAQLFGSGGDRCYVVNRAVVDLIERIKRRTGSTDKGVIVGALKYLEHGLDEQDIDNFLGSFEDDGYDVKF